MPPSAGTGAIISLVGMPGSGKSTVGRHVARHLGLPFVDTDHLIERRIGCSIRDYFETQGEAAFRDVEQGVVDEVTWLTGHVVATGGGAVLRELNRFALHDRTTVVYLRATPEDLARRLAREEGLFVGISAAGAAWVALQLARQLQDATIVFIVCDRGERYLSTGVFPA